MRCSSLSLSPSVLVLQCNQSPVLVHHVVSGLGQLRQVGQQRTQVVELRHFVVTFSTEDLHQLSQTKPLLEDLKQQRHTSSLTIQHYTAESNRVSQTLFPSLIKHFYINHLEHSLAGLLMAGQVGQDGADLIREQVLWIQKFFKQHWQNFDICQQNLGETQ